MKALLIFIVLIHILVTVSSGKSNDCLYASTNHGWDIGETYNPPGECVTLKCLGKNQFSAKTCSPSHAKDCKLIPQDNSKSYPECCPRWDCDKKN